MASSSSMERRRMNSDPHSSSNDETGSTVSFYENEENDNQPSSSTSPSRALNFENQLKKAFELKLLLPYDMKVFVAGNTVFPMHRDLLLLASPFFEGSIRRAGAQQDGRNSLKLFIDADVFRVIRHYLYTNQLSAKPGPFTIDLALKVLDACVQYDIRQIISPIVAKIETITTASSALQVLTSARRLELKDLEDSALKVVGCHARSILKDEEFIHLGSYDVCRILSSDLLRCSEVEVFDAVLRWSMEQSRLSSDFKRGLKYHFGEVMACIRFPLMSPTELATVVSNAPVDIINNDDLLTLFKYVCLPDSLKNTVHLKFEYRRRITMENETVTCKGDKFSMVCKETQTESSFNDIVKINSTLINENVGLLPPKVPRTEIQTPKKSRKRRHSTDEESVTSFAITPSPSPSTKHVSIAEDSDDDSLFTRVVSQNDKTFEAYEDLLRKYYRLEDKDSIGSMIFKNITFRNNHRSFLLKNCNKVIVDAKYKYIDGNERIASFLDFVKHFNPMRYLVFNTEESKKISIENLWSSGQDILLKFNGVIFLKMEHEKSELTLNYVSEARKILNNDRCRPKRLAISNCEFSVKTMKDRGKQLEQLILYRVWGEYTMDEIMRDFPALTELVCWKYVPQVWLKGSSASSPLCLNFSNPFTARYTLQRLVLFQTELRFPVRCSGITTSVAELFLDRCHCGNGARGSHLSEVIDVVFPKLKKLAIVEGEGEPERSGNLATSDVINRTRKKISTIQWIRVVGMKWSKNAKITLHNELESSEDNTLNEFLREAGLPNKPTNYLVEKAETWKGTSNEEGEQEPLEVDGGYWTNMDEMEFQWYNLRSFFETCDVFEDFFIQDSNREIRENFPRPVLWY